MLAGTLAGAAIGEVAAAIVLTVVLRWTWRDALDAFVVTNAAIGLSSAICGGLVAWHRPRNPIGWLFVSGGVAQSAAALMPPLVAVLVDADAPVAAQRVLLTVFGWSWPLSIGLCLPLALLLFPDGRLPSRRWRPVAVAIVVTAPLFSAEMATAPEPFSDGLPIAYGALPFYSALQPLWTFAELRTGAALIAALIALVVRYRRGTEVARRQLLWLVLAVLIAVLATTPWGLVAGTPVAVLLAIPLMPIAATVAIVRHQLLDIRLVVSRALAWAMLSLAVVVGYGLLVAVLDRLITGQVGRSALATVILVLLAAPVLPRLQRLVDRALYGDRGNPERVVAQIGRQLTTADAGLEGVVSAVQSSLHLPYVSLERSGTVLASVGFPPAEIRSWPLSYAGQVVGELRCGLRSGERGLADADQRVLGVLAAPLAVAVHACVASAELQSSRERLVAAREEERRRLRRELHDGLGPTLTGIAFTADAAANLLDGDADTTRELLTSLRRETRTALSDVRRLVDDLRPPALDELGLVGALQQRADALSWRADGAAIRVRVDVPAQVPELPAAVEVATYRVATEALTNVVRHSRATRAVIALSCTDGLELSVTDDGGQGEPWTPGLGLQAMRERVAELGGSFWAGSSPSGGRVTASFPLPSAS